MKIYLAGPFFNEEERKNIEIAKNILIERMFEVFVPMEHKIEGDLNMPNNIWGQKVFEMDKEAIHECEIIVALYYGLYSDSGTAWEIGYANCFGKKIIIVHLGNQIEKSLMITNGCNLNIYSIYELNTLDFNNLPKFDQNVKVEQK